MVNNIKNNTISESHAKQKLNALNEIKKAEIKGKRLISCQKKLLNFFDELLETIFNNDNNNDNNNGNGSSNNNSNNSNNSNSNNYKSESESDNYNESESDSESDNDNESGDEQYYKIKQLNNYFKAIDKTKSFEEQIEILKAKDFLDEYWHEEYHDDKELNLKIFKAKAAYLDTDEDFFKRIFGQTSAALADKLINTTSKEENQIIINDIKTNKDKIFEQDYFNNFVIHPGYRRGDLLDAVKIILKYNEVIQSDLT